MGSVRVVMGVGTVGEDALQFGRKDSVGLVPPALGPDLFNGGARRVYPSKVVSSIFTSPPLTRVQGLYMIMLSMLTMYCKRLLSCCKKEYQL